MQTFHNIADLGQRDYQGTIVYTGYAAGTFWSIRPTVGHCLPDDRAWEAYSFPGSKHRLVMFYGSDLADISRQLDKLANEIR